MSDELNIEEEEFLCQHIGELTFLFQAENILSPSIRGLLLTDIMSCKPFDWWLDIVLPENQPAFEKMIACRMKGLTNTYLGRMKSEKKAAAVRINGRLGGRPKGTNKKKKD